MRIYKPNLPRKEWKKHPDKKWWAELRDHRNKVRRFAAFSDRGASDALGKQIDRLVAYKVAGQDPDVGLVKWLDTIPQKTRGRFVKIGLLDAKWLRGGKLLQELITEFGEHLERKERSQRHVKETVSNLRNIFQACGFVSWSDISAEKLRDHLDLRRDKGEGISKRTYNRLLGAAKQFCKWMKVEKHVTSEPLFALTNLEHEDTDSRHKRTAFSVDELRLLLTTTAKSSVRYGMTGRERHLLYWFAAETGLRVNEIRTLRVSSFDLNELTVTVEAGYSKHRREDVVALKPQLAQELKQFFAAKTPLTKAFGGTYKQLTDKTAKMLQWDLQAAGVAYRDDAGRFRDFHALRHTFITNLKHESSRVAQRLARHSSSKMTDRYTHPGLRDDRAALERMPDLSTTSATGTEG